MAKSKDEKLVEFYNECQQKGYTNMQDEIHSLKAKVIAADLGLDYKNIEKLYENAKAAIERVEKAAEEKDRLENSQGDFYFDCFDFSYSIKPSFSLYCYDKKSYYAIIHNNNENNKRVFDTPKVSIEKAIDMNTYHYAASVDTYGISYNGMTTATSYYNPERTETKFEKSRDDGFISISIGKLVFRALKIKVSARLHDAFKREEAYKKHLSNEENVLVFTRMKLSDCKEAVALLNRMLKQEFPPSDQERYDEALKLKESDHSYEIKKAIDIFNYISDYKDSEQLANNAQKRYDEVRQLEKENAIIAEERGRQKRKTGAIYGAIALVAVIAIVFLLSKVIIPTQKKNKAYNEAMSYYTQGDYTNAYKVFSTLKGYKDVDNLLETDNLRKGKQQYFKRVGNIVSFGSYEQDNETANGSEEIEWIVLDNKGNQSLLISRYVLDWKTYNKKKADDFTWTGKEEVTWETCSLRKWLNQDFLKTAFNSNEQRAIFTSNTTPTTSDMVFLLSYDEVEHYLSSKDARTCKPTAYSLANGAFTSDDGYCSWWLRSPGPSKHAYYVLMGGYLDSDQTALVIVSDGIRPAFWINLDTF